ncbi:hypothetical protein E3J79_04095 [Candidatus Dependentiae bacterium]|nr:MAG: hypothetical protein E3J79_04095 [Candidatus Dependentiae bacterium]
MFVKVHMKYWQLFFIAIGVFLSIGFIAGASKRMSASENKKFTLVTVLYNERNKWRISEYIKCLDINLKHNSIKKICVIYDVSHDEKSQSLPIHDYLKSKNVLIQYINGRPTYGYCFFLIKDIFPNSKIIISNADIYFNNTLGILEDYDLTNKFIALTRWNVDARGNLIPFREKGIDMIGSQDTWIFQTPLPHFERDDIHIGTGYCDSCIMYQAHKAGLTVINPCLSIQCCHVHVSNIKGRRGLCLLPKGYYVPWTKLNER